MLGLKDFVSKEDLVERFLRNLRWQELGSDLDGALQKADDVFTNEGRLQARKVLVVYGDGPFNASVDELRDTRDALEQRNVKVITVTAGDNKENKKKLDEVATTSEGTVIVDPEKTDQSTDDVNERTLKGMLGTMLGNLGTYLQCLTRKGVIPAKFRAFLRLP